MTFHVSAIRSPTAWCDRHGEQLDRSFGDGLPVPRRRFAFADGHLGSWNTLRRQFRRGLPVSFFAPGSATGRSKSCWDNQISLRSLNPAVFTLCAQACNRQTGNVYNDVQTFFLPDTLRGAALRLRSHPTLPHSTVRITSATGLVTGCGCGIVNESPRAEPRSAECKTDPTYNTRAYGGYVLRDTLFGTSRRSKSHGLYVELHGHGERSSGDSVVPALNIIWCEIAGTKS